MTPRPGFRLAALVMVLVLALTLGAPARSEADPTVALAIAGAAVVVVILVVYLVVANVRGPRMRSEAPPVMLACLEADGVRQGCWPVASAAEAARRAPGAPVRLAPAGLEQAP